MYESLFVKGLQVQVGAYLTEYLILNGLQKFNRKIPSVPFWTKEYAKVDKDFAYLAKSYGMEIAPVRDLLIVFAPSVLIEEIKMGKYTTIRYLKKAQKQELLYRLFNNQVKYVRGIENIDASKFEQLANKSLAFENLPNLSFNKNLLGKLSS